MDRSGCCDFAAIDCMAYVKVKAIFLIITGRLIVRERNLEFASLRYAQRFAVVLDSVLLRCLSVPNFRLTSAFEWNSDAVISG